MPRSSNTGPLCVVNIGFHMELLLPMKKALQLVELLQSSVHVRPDYSSRSARVPYEIQGAPEVICQSVRADQIRQPLDPRTTLTHNPSESLS